MATTKKPDDDEPKTGPRTDKKPADAPIEANQPYPTGNPPDPEDAFEQAHGFRRTPKKE